MPELVRLVSQGKPMIRRYDLAVLVDRAEDHEIGANAQRADFGYFERSKATRVSKLRLIGDVLAAKDNDRMLLKGRTRQLVRGVVRRDLGERYPAQFSSKARTQRDDVHRRPPFGVCSTLPSNRLVWRFAFATAATDPAELTPRHRRCPRFSDRDRDPPRRRALARAAHAAAPAGRSSPRGSAARSKSCSPRRSAGRTPASWSRASSTRSDPRSAPRTQESLARCASSARPDAGSRAARTPRSWD